jgi:hypothetical protein
MKKWVIRIGVAVIVLLVLALVAVGMMLGSILKKGVETVGPMVTKTELKLDHAHLSLLTGSGSVKGLLVGNPEGFNSPSAIKVGKATLGVKPGSVFADKVHVTHLRVEAPEITFEGVPGGNNNLSKLLENVQAATGGGQTDKGKPGSKPGSGASRKLQVDEITITGAKVNASLPLLGGKALTLPLPDIQIRDLGQGPDGITTAELTRRILSEVTVATLKAVDKGAADLGKTATDAAAGAVKGVTDLLKKKK